MKCKFSFLLVLLIAFFFNACKDSQQKKIKQVKDHSQPEKNRPFTEITFEQADAIVKNYQDNFMTVLQRNAGPTIRDTQTRHLWIDINELKDFITILEKEANSNKFNTQLSGIRFYFAAYLKDGNIHHKPEYARRTTLVGCGTYKDGEYHRDLISPSVADPYIKAFVLGYQNHGHLCPPEDPKFCAGGLGHPYP